MFASILGKARRATASLLLHGFFAQDGNDPKAMLETMRGQVAAYPTVHFRAQKAVAADRHGEAFRMTLADGEAVIGTKLLLASGISDVLPDIPGVAERWGQTVIHCPYCHGYEFREQRLGVLNLSPVSVHQASLIPEWGPTTFFLNGGTIDAEAKAALEQRGVAVEPEPVEGLVGEGTSLSALRLRNGIERPIDALFIGPANRLNSDIPERLGCAIEQGPLGSVVTVDDMKATNVSGIYAAGDITRMGHTVTFACADGVMAALAIHRSLAFGAE